MVHFVKMCYQNFLGLVNSLYLANFWLYMWYNCENLQASFCTDGTFCELGNKTIIWYIHVMFLGYNSFLICVCTYNMVPLNVKLVHMEHFMKCSSRIFLVHIILGISIMGHALYFCTFLEAIMSV